MPKRECNNKKNICRQICFGINANEDEDGMREEEK
jgi:hypothetical protein